MSAKQAQRSIQHPHFRNRHDEPPAPLADVRGLRADLLPQVPRQDQHIVRPRRPDRVGRKNRNARSRRELALLVRIGVDGEVEEIGADAAVVEQRVALARRAVADDLLAAFFRVDQERQELALGGPRPARRSRGSASSVRKPSSTSRCRRRLTAFADRKRRVFAVPTVDAQRSAVGRQLFDVEQRQAVVRKDRSTATNEK